MELKLRQEGIIKLLFTLLILYVNFIQYKVYQNSLIMLGLGTIIIGMTFLNAIHQGTFVIEKPITTLLLFTIYMAIPTLLFGNSESSAEYVTVIEYTIILICLIKFCTSINDVEWLIKVKVLCTIFICIAFILNPAVYHDKVNTIQYTLVQSLNPNTFSLDILIGLWSLLYLNAKKKINMLVTSMVSLLFMYCIFITAARKSLLCALLAIILWILWIYIPGKGSQKRTAILGRILVIVILGFIIVYYTMKNLMDSEMFYRFQSLLSGGDGSANKRLNMYIEGVHTFISNPILGYGVGGFQSLYGGYSHATVVEVPVSGGIIGALLYGKFFVEMIMGTKRVKDLKVLKKMDCSGDIMNLILCIIMVVLCVCVIHPYLFNSYIAIAIIISLYTISRNEIVKCDSE